MAERTLAARVARLRVPLGFLFGLAVWYLARPTRTTIEVGMGVACVGEAVRIWAAGHLNKSREVTSSGPYRWLAHPLYVGSSILGAGLAIASGSALVAAVIALYLTVTLTAAVKNEEAFLRRTFGEEYERYRQRGEIDAKRRFSVAQVWANREYRAVVGLMLALLLLAIRAKYAEVRN